MPMNSRRGRTLAYGPLTRLPRTSVAVRCCAPPSPWRRSTFPTTLFAQDCRACGGTFLRSAENPHGVLGLGVVVDGYNQPAATSAAAPTSRKLGARASRDVDHDALDMVYDLREWVAQRQQIVVHLRICQARRNTRRFTSGGCKDETIWIACGRRCCWVAPVAL